MKPTLCYLCSLLVTTTTPLVAQAAEVDVNRAPAPVVVLERGPHHKVVQTASGGTYTALGTGMNFLRDGQYLEAREEIVIDNNGYGVADQAQHTARFSPSITDVPALRYTDPDGNVFQTTILGLAFFDYGSSTSALFCQTKPSIGVVSANTVTYTNAFSDNVNADVRLTRSEEHTSELQSRFGIS